VAGIFLHTTETNMRCFTCVVNHSIGMCTSYVSNLCSTDLPKSIHTLEFVGFKNWLDASHFVDILSKNIPSLKIFSFVNCELKGSDIKMINAERELKVEVVLKDCVWL
jgi:hypothetical protein